MYQIKLTFFSIATEVRTLVLVIDIRPTQLVRDEKSLKSRPHNILWKD